DVVDGGEGADRMYGDGGDDELVAGLGDVWVEGGTGTDGLTFRLTSAHSGTLTDIDYTPLNAPRVPYFTVEGVPADLQAAGNHATPAGPTLPLALLGGTGDEAVTVKNLPAPPAVTVASADEGLPIPATGTAGAIPSTLTVSGVRGRVADLDVGLDISHT